jgi:hypothetical protein
LPILNVRKIRMIRTGRTSMVSVDGIAVMPYTNVGRVSAIIWADDPTIVVGNAALWSIEGPVRPPLPGK